MIIDYFNFLLFSLCIKHPNLFGGSEKLDVSWDKGLHDSNILLTYRRPRPEWLAQPSFVLQVDWHLFFGIYIYIYVCVCVCVCVCDLWNWQVWAKFLLHCPTFYSLFLSSFPLPAFLCTGDWRPWYTFGEFLPLRKCRCKFISIISGARPEWTCNFKMEQLNQHKIWGSANESVIIHSGSSSMCFCWFTFSLIWTFGDRKSRN